MWCCQTPGVAVCFYSHICKIQFTVVNNLKFNRVNTGFYAKRDGQLLHETMTMRFTKEDKKDT